MANQLQAGPEPSVTSLVTGIVNDAENLIKQQLDLFKHEVKEEVRKAKEGVTALGLGLVVLLVGGILLLTMPVYLLQWAVPSLPLWACFGIVGVVIAIAGGVLLFLGKKELEEVHPLEESAEALKENVQWITKPK
jgi:hypothetical protein